MFFFVYIDVVIKFQGIDEGLMEECKADNSGDMIYKCMYAPVSRWPMSFFLT